MNYGLPYKGSKNKLAERIVRLLPQRKHLYDLFCGGCAVSHAALLMGKYEHIHINDFNWMCPTLFMDALAGKYDNETRWISREDFQRLKTTDPYVAVVWSFGNNMRDYMYSREIEPLKRAIHYAIFFSDYEPGLELGHDLSFVDGISDLQQRYSLIRRYFAKDMHSPAQSFEGGARLQRMQNVEALQRLNIQPQTGGGRNVSTRLETVERLANVRAKQYTWSGLPGCGQFKKKNHNTTGKREPTGPAQPDCNTGNGYALWNKSGGGQDLPITSSVKDYAEVEIQQDSVIYCDIPYENTKKYVGAEHFDYERFYDWACRQTEPVFISSYNMPKDKFECIAEFSHTVMPTQWLDDNHVTERIFIPRGQTERGNLPPRQLSLFDDM